jgi:type IX secretion system PorP/SprF family membrane protein
MSIDTMKTTNMKRILLGLLCIKMGAAALAQQKPHYTQYILNQYVINPALSGIENYTDVKFSHRHQWQGFQDGPVTTYFTIHAPIGKKDFRTTATSYGVPGENPRGNNYWEDYTAAAPHHGVGLQVINDNTGPLSQFSAYVSYAYHLGLTPKTSLAAGFGAGISSLTINASKLNFGNSSVDPAVYTSGELRKLRPDLNVGLYLYSADYFIGLSAQQVIPQKIDFSNNAVRLTEGRTVPHVFATAGYRFLVGEDFNLIPSVMVKYIDPIPVQWELNAKLQYRDLAWAGLSYRHTDGIAGMIGLNVSNTFNISYAYDQTSSTLNRFSNGTHELMLGFILGNKYGDSCPRNVW